MDPKPDDPILPFADEVAFGRWLATNHRSATVVWIKYAKKGTGEPSINWTQAVDVALCYGWIDGQAKSLDERYYLQRFTPRRPTSPWSKINRDRITRLIAEGRMRAAGLAEVERAKADGRWDAAYDSPSTATVPDDLAKAIAKNAKAKVAFAKLGSSARYAILYKLQQAKQQATRDRHIAAFVATLMETAPTPRAKARKK